MPVLPSAAVMQQTATVIIELGATGILTQSHADVLCDGIGDLAAHCVTDWRAAGLAIKAIELVAVFGQDLTHGRDWPPSNVSLARKKQLGRQLERLAAPEPRN